MKSRVFKSFVAAVAASLLLLPSCREDTFLTGPYTSSSGDDDSSQTGTVSASDVDPTNTEDEITNTTSSYTVTITSSNYADIVVTIG